MSRILILSDEYPHDQTSGLHLRVRALCRELSHYHVCYFVAISTDRADFEHAQDAPFEEVKQLPVRTKDDRTWRRHIRFSNARYLEYVAPIYFQRTVATVREYVTTWGIDALVSFAPPFAEIGAAINAPKMLDHPDCASLTLKRLLARRRPAISLKKQALIWLQLHRQTARESHFLQTYDLTMTIAEPDRKRFLEVADIDPERVIVVPNGVTSELIRQETACTKRTRSVVFWGNLDFPPNWTAIVYFYEQVYLPYLAGKGIEWYIVGKGAGQELTEIAQHPLIHMAGFQRDLASYVADKGVMINPMTEGSGLKNKVLEAFAMRIPVVSTPLGVEAINGIAGEHFLAADTPEKFSQSVLQLIDSADIAESLAKAARDLVLDAYTWEVAGRKFVAAVQKLL